MPWTVITSDKKWNYVTALSCGHQVQTGRYKTNFLALLHCEEHTEDIQMYTKPTHRIIFTLLTTHWSTDWELSESCITGPRMCQQGQSEGRDGGKKQSHQGGAQNLATVTRHLSKLKDSVRPPLHQTEKKRTREGTTQSFQITLT